MSESGTEQTSIAIPSYLETPPAASYIAPPVETRQQELPFAALAWEDFEKLSLRIARLDADVEHCHFYGTSGQRQEGIDLYARRKLEQKYSVYQCKRVRNFGPSQIRDAVSTFLKGEWVSKTDRFVLCTIESLRSTDRADTVEEQRAVLAGRGVALVIHDSTQLSLLLKDIPKLVDDFFGRHWVERFCGPEQARALGRRFDLLQVGEFRARLGAFYRKVFNTQDPGLPVITLERIVAPSIEDRFVLPDVYDRHVSEEREDVGVAATRSEDELEFKALSSASLEGLHRGPKMARRLESYVERRGVEEWLAAEPRSMILGGPGSGKSTLLRFLAIDLLSEAPRLSLLAQKWAQFLPVWIPFPLWTRLVSEPGTSTCSLSEALRAWLRSWDEEDLWPLVEQALEDERLLLLVDGLDEWASEDAARIAVDRLQVFLRREIPAVVTGRPHSLQRLSMNTATWQVAQIADFDQAQKRELSRIWFVHWLRSLRERNGESEALFDRSVDSVTASFLSELQSSPDLVQISGVPLLLCLLVGLRLQEARLPQSRFKAYDVLIHTFITAHPQRRRRAATLPVESKSSLSDDEMRVILAAFAYHIHETSGEGLIGDERAAVFLEEQLAAQEGDFGFDRQLAKQLAKEALGIGEGTIGLLVRKSPRELGFFHRVFQEFLAGFHLSRMALSLQLATVKSRCSDAWWREVLLALFHFTRRSEDIDAFVTSVESRSCTETERQSIDELVCAVAFGEFNCPVATARRMAARIATEIEIGWWMPHRERLLQLMLDGLRSARMREFVRSRLSRWFPSRIRWRASLYKAIAGWPSSPDVTECLWRGIHEEETPNLRAAAHALALSTRGNPDTAARLAALATRGVDVRVRAAAIEGLVQGWPDHSDLARILSVARKSLAPELRLVAIDGAVERGTRSDDDWTELIRLGSWRSGLEFYWRHRVRDILIRGWSGDARTKELCLHALSPAYGDRLESEIAYGVLLEGFPGDEDVAIHCVHEIRTKEHPFAGTDVAVWRSLSRHFRDHPGLTTAIDEWMRRQKYGGPETTYASLLGRTQTVKEKLIELMDSAFPHWSLDALLEGWGVEDPEVSAVVSSLAWGPARSASEVGYLLPRIITDRAECRRRLLDLLKDPTSGRYDFLLQGLVALGGVTQDREVVDIVFEYVLPRLAPETWWFESVSSLLIGHYSFDARVKKLAEQAFLTRFGGIVDAAYAYADEEEFRRMILQVASPLPTVLRMQIASRLGDGAGDDETALALLKFYDLEEDPEVKTQASIAFHTRLRASGKDTSSAVHALSRAIVCYGPDYDERRQAAFCGLVVLGRLDVMTSAQENIGEEDRRCKISLGAGISQNVVLVRFVAHNWDGITAVLGDEVYDRLTKFSGVGQFLVAFCLAAYENASARDAALGLLANAPKPVTAPSVLRFIGRARPRGALLLEHCFAALCLDDDSRDCQGEEAVVAAELLGEHFGGDADVLARITSSGRSGRVYEKLILALAEGWPDAEQLTTVLDVLEKTRFPLSYPTFFRLLCRKAEPHRVLDETKRFISGVDPMPSRTGPLILQPIVRRLREDDELWERLVSLLAVSPGPSLKTTVPKLMSAARGVTADLERWCEKELGWQLESSETPEIGYDLTEGILRPVVHTLLDTLQRPPIVG